MEFKANYWNKCSQFMNSNKYLKPTIFRNLLAGILSPNCWCGDDFLKRCKDQKLSESRTSEKKSFFTALRTKLPINSSGNDRSF